MSPAAAVEAEPERLLPIGRVAELAEVSERTLHYYEQIGLLIPAQREAGRRRRYTRADLERLRHIRELQEVMGYSLAEIQAILGAEDRMVALRTAWRGRPDQREQRRILEQALEITEGHRRRVHAKIERLQGILDRLDTKTTRYQQLRAQLNDPAPDGDDRAGDTP